MTFSKFLEGYDPCPPDMPLVHSTDLYKFTKIIEKGKLVATLCDVFNEKLLYFFYGRPAYRVAPHIKGGLRPPHMPICLLMQPEMKIPVTRIFPFDSGAFESKLFRRFIPEEFPRDSYELGTELNLPQRIVNAFFGSNQRYLAGEVQNVSIPDLELEVAAFYALIRDTSVSFADDDEPFPDDRRYSIEIQSKKDVQLQSLKPNRKRRKALKRKNAPPVLIGAKVRAVILPRYLLDNPTIRTTVTTTWEAALVPYHSASFQSPLVLHGAVGQVASDYLRTEKFL